MLFEAPTISDRTTTRSQLAKRSKDRLGDSLLVGKCLYEFLTGMLGLDSEENISTS